MAHTTRILETLPRTNYDSYNKNRVDKYWYKRSQYNMKIRMAKHSYNSKLKEYRRHTWPANLEQVQTEYKEYPKLCTHVRNLSWNQWITDCNNNINSSEVWRRIKAAKGTAPRAPTHHRPQEETDSLCDSFAQRCSPESLHEDTINNLTQMAPARVRTITTEAYKPVDTDQEFTLSELEDVLYRLKDTAPGDDTVCLRFINQSFTEGRLPTKWKMANIIPTP